MNEEREKKGKDKYQKETSGKDEGRATSSKRNLSPLAPFLRERHEPQRVREERGGMGEKRGKEEKRKRWGKGMKMGVRGRNL